MIRKRNAMILQDWIIGRVMTEEKIGNHPWCKSHAERAGGLYPTDPNIALAAACVAMVDEHIVQYLEQAPVLILALIKRANMTLMDQQRTLVKLGKSVFENQPKLSDLMAKYKLPFPLRKISGEFLERDHIDLFREFQDVNPSIIAQSIPEDPKLHRDWLNTIKAWIGQLKNRIDPNRLKDMTTLPHIDWVLIRVGQYLSGAELQIANRQDVASRWMGELADFMLAHDVEWNDRWTLQVAYDKAMKWHEELQRKDNSEKFFSLYGIQWEDKIDFGPVFPKSWKAFQEVTEEGKKKKVKVHTWNIVPVNSGRDLFMEGKIMHHCVASYADSVVKHKSFIFSVRDLEGNPLTTFELQPNGGSGYRLIQQKAHCNHAPSNEIQTAIADYVSRANQGEEGFVVEKGRK